MGGPLTETVDRPRCKLRQIPILAIRHLFSNNTDLHIDSKEEKCSYCGDCYLKGESETREIEVPIDPAVKEKIEGMKPNNMYGGAENNKKKNIIPEVIDEIKLKELITELKKSDLIKNNKNIDDIFKIKNVFNKIIKKYQDIDDNFDNEKNNNLKLNAESKFDIYKHYFKRKEYITVDFIKYLVKCIFIPHKTHDYYIKKKKITTKLDKIKQKIDKRYDFTILSKNKENEKLIKFIDKYKMKEKDLENYEKILTGENLTNQSINSIVDEHKFLKIKLLEFKKESINDEKIKKYFIDRYKYDRTIEKINELAMDYFLIRKETKFFENNLKIKKLKFFELNKFFLRLMSYIENEINIGVIFKIKIEPKTKNIYIKILKEIYIHFYTLKKKIFDINRKIKKRRIQANTEFKKILLKEEVLKKDINKTIIKKQKDELIEKYKLLSRELFFFKYNFYNLKQCIQFNKDIINKSSVFLCNIDYSIQYVKNGYLFNYLNMLNLDKIKPDKFEQKLIKIKNNYKSLLAAKIRLFIEKKHIVKKYNKIINLSIKKANRIDFKGIVPSKEKKILEDAENLKKIRIYDDIKIKLEEEIHNLVDINIKYLILKKPLLVLVNKGFIESKKIIIKKTVKRKRKKDKSKDKNKSKKVLKFNGLRFEFKDDKLDKININKNNRIVKLLEVINKYYNKEQRFNTYVTLKKFVTA